MSPPACSSLSPPPSFFFWRVMRHLPPPFFLFSPRALSRVRPCSVTWQKGGGRASGPGPGCCGSAHPPSRPPPYSMAIFPFFPKAVRVAMQEVGLVGGPVAPALGAAALPTAPPLLLFFFPCTPSCAPPCPAARHAGRMQGGGGRPAAPALGAAVPPPSPVLPPLRTQRPVIAAHSPLFGTGPPAGSVTKVAPLVPFTNCLPRSTGHPGPVACILGGAHFHLDGQVP